MQYLGYFYIFVPLVFILLVALRRQPNTLTWAISSAPFALVIIFLWVSARWEIPSIYLRPVFPVLMMIALYAGYKRIRAPEQAPSKASTIINIVISGFTFFIISVMTVFSFLGYSLPSDMVDLKSPLRGGEFVVLHGGTGPFINGHAKIRPQNFAIDVVGVNQWGMRAQSITGGPVLEDYVIFGTDIYAPCDGEIILSVDGLEDLIPPKTDPQHLAGNHVLLRCGDFEVLLAHMKMGSLRLAAGDQVDTDTILGQVGNTGNTSEPHLHMHAERGGDENTILNGKAVAFTINGEFLLRGDVF